MQTAMCAEMSEQFKNKMQVNPESQKYASNIVPFTRECGVVFGCLNNMSCLLAHMSETITKLLKVGWHSQYSA